ncbi:MAG: sugar ABC transporter substrate-binding protein, partial [Actinomycetota bacterium]|nr:sugar ABC transporter substrate-binding protein [Actinomycetota bacterium]
MRWSGLRLAIVATACASLVALTGCGAGGGGGGGAKGSKTVRVLMVNNPQMVDLAKLAKDNFT